LPTALGALMTDRSYVIHVIENDEAVRDSLRALLEAHGYRVETYGSPRLLLGRGTSSATGCILVNLSSADGDGASLVREIRRGGVGLPVVATINEPDPAGEAEARRAGALAVLTKPWDVSHLLAVLEGAKGAGLRLLP
jgi:two-component system, LuxR family, response regulator FixJ